MHLNSEKMKNISVSFIAFLLLISACNQKEKETKTEEKKMANSDSSNIPAEKKKFEGIVFASKRDTTCGMPLTAGLEDTLMVNGKIYGFCAKECKDEFIKKLSAKK